MIINNDVKITDRESFIADYAEHDMFPEPKGARNNVMSSLFLCSHQATNITHSRMALHRYTMYITQHRDGVVEGKYIKQE